MCADTTYDSGFIAGGWFEPHYYKTVIKFNKNGDSLWTKYYGFYIVTDICSTSDSGFVLVYTDHYDTVTILKADIAGDSVWSKRFVGFDITSIEQNTYGDYLLAGSYNNDGFLLKLDNTGDSLWSRTYGGSGNEAFNDIEQTPDGGYIMVGYTHSYGSGGADVYVVKTDSLGNTLGVEENISSPTYNPNQIAIEYLSSGNAIVSFVLDTDKDIDFSIYDLSGRIINNQQLRYSTDNFYSIELLDYQPGIYFYSIKNSDISRFGKFSIY
ncbi:MAG: hypothetical protein APR63_12435 [Desulfuromonas sp. SDB]|nr:MAG: hypothetical protein APR63_12435 [Desulfuromonas sp. SDB]